MSTCADRRRFDRIATDKPVASRSTTTNTDVVRDVSLHGMLLTLSGSWRRLPRTPAWARLISTATSAASTWRVRSHTSKADRHRAALPPMDVERRAGGDGRTQTSPTARCLDRNLRWIAG